MNSTPNATHSQKIGVEEQSLNQSSAEDVQQEIAGLQKTYEKDMNKVST